MKLLKPQWAVDFEITTFLRGVWSILTNPLVLKTGTKSADYQALKTDSYIGITSTSSPRTVTLPALNEMEDGALVIVKDQSGGCAANNITVEGYGSETIDGAANYLLNTNYAAVILIKMSSGWFTL